MQPFGLNAQRPVDWIVLVRKVSQLLLCYSFPSWCFCPLLQPITLPPSWDQISSSFFWFMNWHPWSWWVLREFQNPPKQLRNFRGFVRACTWVKLMARDLELTWVLPQIQVPIPAFHSMLVFFKHHNLEKKTESVLVCCMLEDTISVFLPYV